MKKPRATLGNKIVFPKGHFLWEFKRFSDGRTQNPYSSESGWVDNPRGIQVPEGTIAEIVEEVKHPTTGQRMFRVVIVGITFDLAVSPGSDSLYYRVV